MVSAQSAQATQLPERPADPQWDAETAAEVARTFDLRSVPKSFYENPYPTYHALREHAPVKRCVDGSLLLTRYSDVLAVYRDQKTFSSDKKAEFFPKYGDSPLYEHHTTSLVFNDPPLHTRVRQLIVGALTPRAIAKMQPGLEALVANLLNQAEDNAGEIDLIDDFASAIPVEIIGNLLDVPTAERAPLRDWSLAILGALEPSLTPAQEERGNTAVREFTVYLEDLIARRRAKPGDPATDVLTRLIQGDDRGNQLSPAELVQNCIFILNAGHETTTNLIGNGLYALLEWPDERARLVADPGLIETAVEEFLRFESSNQLGNRMTTCNTNIADVDVSSGTGITLVIGAANRDPDQFPEPDRLDLSRKPNRHLAFGSGAHTCAGLSLARLEGQIAIGELVRRFPNYSLRDKPVRGNRLRFRGFLSLPAKLS